MSSKVLFVLGCLALAGCSSDDTQSTGGDGGSSSGGKSSGGTDAGTGGSSSGGTDAGTGGAAGGDTFSLSGVVADATGGDAERNFDVTKYPMIAGVEVCVFEDDSVPCVKTNADGAYTLPGIPAGKQVYISFKKEGLVPFLFAVTLTADTEGPGVLTSPPAYAQELAEKGGYSWDPEKGSVLFGAVMAGPFDSPFKQDFGGGEVLYYVPDYKIEVDPPTAQLAFVSADWEPDTSLTESSKAGWGFFQADPGEYTVTITHPKLTCGSTKTSVVAGHTTTSVGVFCTGSLD